MTWRAVTFYTSGTGYEEEVKKLRASAKDLNVPLDEYAFPPLDDWRKNLNYKSHCILQAMRANPKSDIVFIDADAIIRSWPRLFDDLSGPPRLHDIAAHFFQWRESSKVELLSGTLWIANTVKMRDLIETWDKMGREHPEIRHQVCLQMILDLRKDILVFHLPIEYTCIFDAPSRKGKAAVIEHFQASRKYRRRMIAPKRTVLPPFNIGNYKAAK
jgi:hypothetical protein